MFAVRLRRHRVANLLALVALFLVIAGSACSSNADVANAAFEDGDRAALPDSFPSEVPIPAHETAEIVTDDAEGGRWNVVFTLESEDGEVLDSEEIAGRYVAQLEDAGFEAEKTRKTVGKGSKDDVNVSFRAYPGSLAIIAEQ